jgi:hypothetical protein
MTVIHERNDPFPKILAVGTHASILPLQIFPPLHHGTVPPA